MTQKTILQIALDNGFSNMDTFTRNFKAIFGLTPSDYRNESIILNPNKGEVKMKFLSQLGQCSIEEKTQALVFIEKIVEMSKEAHKKGLLSLEGYNLESVFLGKAVELLVDGTEADLLRSILENYIETSDLSAKELLERVIYLEGILMIQSGAYPYEIRQYLVSFLGESLIGHVNQNSTLSQEHVERFLNHTLIACKDVNLEKEIKHYDHRRMQRLLRECDLLVLLIACLGLKKQVREHVFNNLSSRNKYYLLDLYSLLNDMSIASVSDAQSHMVSIIQQLKKAGDL